MRDNDIKVLLEFTSNLIKEIEEEKNKSIKDESKLELFKPRIKTCLENLRSCLDYSAQDIYDFYKLKVTTSKLKKFNKIYFPYSENSTNFKKHFNTNYPDLKILIPAVYVLIESIQPYRNSGTWLLDLCKQTNNIKHNELTKQTKVKSKLVNISDGAIVGEGSDCVISGNIIDGVIQSNDVVIKNNEIISNVDLNGSDIIILDKLNYYFKDTKINIIELMKISHIGISRFIEQLYLLLK